MQKLVICIFLLFVFPSMQTFGSNADNLLGNYGFLTDFSDLPPDEIRQRIQIMVNFFGIKEFQFYDWFADYSTPTAGEQWWDPFFKRRKIFRQSILVCIDEIHRLGGRAWAYVQAAGSENKDLDATNPGIFRLIDQSGRRYEHMDTIPVYFLNREWAIHQVSIWGEAVKDLGFDGIHWDTLGSLSSDYTVEERGVWDFIKTSFGLLKQFGLRQNMNFVDLAWFDLRRVARYIEFPYAELWSKSTEDFVVRMSRSPSHGVVVSYSSYVFGDKEEQFEEILDRAIFAKQNGHTFLLVGDGNYRLETEYFPSRIELTEYEKKEISKLK